ncbi:MULTISPECIES: hypothetical protein [unclassified Neorhizobium]|uniref:hypothetical protein n=1 Tax=unclassified Neorhizobium TaxID=2629175 RepID=UPI001FF4D882|nr:MULTISPECIES: hypothetical protein [unclassified Neorhizobium]MCJ9674056.1 hypothetical protein [Neorhizobium sp. SHOUNA12B]MCJ9748855.1 hypothetical protein [Neorhizobium sp. SHOUNA12A]
MVSSINSIRIWSSQAALNAFKDVSDNRTPGSSTSGSSSSSLADMLFPGSNGGDDYEDDKIAALIASLQRTMNGTAPDETAGDGSVDDMSSKAFMKALQEKLDALKANPDSKAMAEAMQKALDAGTLKLTDAVAGDQITAWDITDGKQTSTGVTSVDKSDWTQFLKDRLTRDDGGKFVRNADGSYIEKATGASSYFGMVGEAYYYISWPTPAATTKPAAGATPAASASTK